MKKLLTTLAAAIGLAATTFAAVVDLSTVTADRTISSGTTVTGTLGRDVKLSIASGATVTLSNAVINGGNDSGCKWAGLTCMGNATIILVGENNVKGFYQGYPGIYVPSASTLTIRGSGSIMATGCNKAAGIGGGLGTSIEYDGDCGNIVINGGEIVAMGGAGGAGIGGGQSTSCGNIVINDGMIQSRGGDGGAGIGSGYGGNCGSIAIKGGGAAAIGGGNVSMCGAGIGSGVGGKCGVVMIGEGIVGIEAATQAVDSPLGAGTHGTCDAVVKDEYLLVEEGYDFDTGYLGCLIWPRKINLASLTDDEDIEDGMIVTGTLAANVKVSIDDGATVTFRDVTINGVNDSNYPWAGITCDGDATIILEGNNTVSGFYEDYPGIYVPEYCTLTIKGDGSLNASSRWGAGIGGGWQIACGNIVIEGGDVTASSFASVPIGGGYQAACGDITIAKGVTRVSVTSKGAEAPASIGAMRYGTVGTVTIGGVVTGPITKCPYTYPEQLVDLSGLSSAYTAQDGDVMRGETAYGVTIPGGATVTVNGVTITGAAGGTVLPSPAFSAGGKAAMTEFTKGANGKWTLTAFAELANDALGKDVTAGQIKVYRADTPQGLGSASPMTSGVEVKGKKSAVMTTIEVTPPTGAQSQFFKVKFGE